MASRGRNQEQIDEGGNCRQIESGIPRKLAAECNLHQRLCWTSRNTDNIYRVYHEPVFAGSYFHAYFLGAMISHVFFQYTCPSACVAKKLWKVFFNQFWKLISDDFISDGPFGTNSVKFESKCHNFNFSKVVCKMAAILFTPQCVEKALGEYLLEFWLINDWKHMGAYC